MEAAALGVESFRSVARWRAIGPDPRDEDPRLDDFVGCTRSLVHDPHALDGPSMPSGRRRSTIKRSIMGSTTGWTTAPSTGSGVTADGQPGRRWVRSGRTPCPAHPGPNRCGAVAISRTSNPRTQTSSTRRKVTRVPSDPAAHPPTLLTR